MATTARLDMRLDPSIKARAEKASALIGARSLTEYIVRLIDADATRVLAEHEQITLSNDCFDQFICACAHAEQPNRALRDAAEQVKADPSL